MANVIRRSRHSKKSRGTGLSMISFNGVDQYASAGYNPNVKNALDFNKDFAVTFVIKINKLLALLADPLERCAVWSMTTTDSNSNILQRGVQSFITRIDTSTYALNLYCANQYTDFTKTYLFQFDFNISVDDKFFIVINHNSNKTGIIYLNSVPGNTQIIRPENYTNTSFYNGNYPLLIGASGMQSTSSRYSDLSICDLTFYNRTLTEKEIIYEHQNAKPHPDTYGNIVARYEPGKNGHTILDKVQDYNPALTPYHATIYNYTDAEVGIPDQSTNTAYKDFHTKQNIVTL